MRKLTEHNNWISTDVIKVLKHNLNFSNWTDTYACEGRWEIEFKSGQSIIEIYMPTSRWGEQHSFFFTLYSGKIEFGKNEVLIWQNDKVPVRLSYAESENNVELNILGFKIRFEKKLKDV